MPEYLDLPDDVASDDFAESTMEAFETYFRGRYPSVDDCLLLAEHGRVHTPTSRPNGALSPENTPRRLALTGYRLVNVVAVAAWVTAVLVMAFRGSSESMTLLAAIGTATFTTISIWVGRRGSIQSQVWSSFFYTNYLNTVAAVCLRYLRAGESSPILKSEAQN
ncbi:hypothetical protein EIP91_006826 [Steccherinum ochraceum]|uniref:Uncharacterized protein n=1 Tax=Steccherinum ochraceum TaxID=92696 RepID=A0A4R0RFP5_9APHY|nr:hypothetical protein EIP91_006826 [Steccherinum ochraceum]